MGKVKYSEIKLDRIKREQYLDGYLHGTSGVKKNLPTYEIESYELGYLHGSKGKIEFYSEISELNIPKKNEIPLTRQKRRKKND